MMATDNEAFEKLLREADLPLPSPHGGIYYIKYLEKYKSFATSYAKSAKADSAKEIAELKEHINNLCEALRAIKEVCIGDRFNRWDTPEVITRRRCYIADECDIVLATTPPQSLKAHDDELIERCAKECEYAATPYRDADKFYICAEAVRALKG